VDVIGDKDKSNTIMGSDVSENIVGGDKADTIYTGGGFDTVESGKGNDTIYLGRDEKYLLLKNGDGVDTVYFDGTKSLNLLYESAHKFRENGDDYYDYPSDVYFERFENDLIIVTSNDSNNPDKLILKDYFNIKDEVSVAFGYIQSGETSVEELLTSQGYDVIDSEPVKEITYTEFDIRTYNKKGVELAKADKVTMAKGDFALVAGKGNDTITLNEGNMCLKFNKGDGTDTVYLNGANTLLLDFESVSESGIDSLSYQKQGNDLIILSPSGKKADDKVIIKDYFNNNYSTDISIGNTKEKTEISTLLENALIHAGSAKANNTFSDSQYNDIINGGSKVDKITLNVVQGNDTINLKTGNDVITFNNLYQGDDNLSVITGKGTKTFDITAIENAEFVVSRYDNNLNLGFVSDDFNDITIQDYFKSGAVLSLKDAYGSRTLKYGSGKVSGTKGDDIVFASANKKGVTSVSTSAGNDVINIDVTKGNKITVSSGDGNDYINFETMNLGTGGKNTFTANLNGGNGDDTYDLSDVDLAKGKIVVNMSQGSDTIVLDSSYSFDGYSGEKTDFSYSHAINNGNSIITNNYKSFDYSNDLSLFFDVKIDKRGISYGYNRTGDLYLVKGADIELADGKVDRGIQLTGISKDDYIQTGNETYHFDESAIGRLISDVASWLSDNDYVSTADVFKTGDVNDIHTLIDMYATGTNQCFVKE
ncbi:MAG: hypothetical protein NC200_08295, partial [Candidatus Gastranaerophilales bacterium]|nr:hypothetical protein [Candidatus Gastranaerophilales bacterium]